jgi:alpha-galactosidase
MLAGEANNRTINGNLALPFHTYLCMMGRWINASPLRWIASALSFAAACSGIEVDPYLRHPIRVFLMVGQSNMVGHGAIDETDRESGEQKNATLTWLVDNAPDQYGKLKSGTDRHWTSRDDIMIACNHQGLYDLTPEMRTYGNLSAGLCGGDAGQFQIGPELGFGWAVGDALNHARDGGDIAVLLKVAWGGRSLAVDFRPPSSHGFTGLYYTSVINHVKAALANLTAYFPSTSGRPIKLSGMAWHQGWNDGCDDRMTDEYEYNLVNLIRDIRGDDGLSVPNMPFVVGISGMSGYEAGRRAGIVEAQMAVSNFTKYPEFEGDVASVDTRPFLREPAPHSPSNLGYHWNNNGESYWLLGQGMGAAMVELVLRREAEDGIRRGQASHWRTAEPSDAYGSVGR